MIGSSSTIMMRDCLDATATSLVSLSGSSLEALSLRLFALTGLVTGSVFRATFSCFDIALDSSC